MKRIYLSLIFSLVLSSCLFSKSVKKDAVPGSVVKKSGTSTPVIKSSGKTYYVAQKTGANSNAGTKEAPFKNIEKALKKAKDGDTILIAEGNYSGLRGKGYLESKITVEMYGGYSSDFATRDVLKHKTLFQPPNKSGRKGSKPLLSFLKSKKGSRIVIDGIIFDSGFKNAYHPKQAKPEGVETGRFLVPPEAMKGQTVSVIKPCLYIPASASAGDVIIRNNAFLNCAQHGIQAGHKEGTFTVENNIFVGCRMDAVTIYGTAGKNGPSGPISYDGDVVIANNTFAFTWSGKKDLQTQGYAIQIKTGVSYNIHDNIILGSVGSGVNHTLFNKADWIKMDNNIFSVNKQADLLFSERGQGVLERVRVSDFGDIELGSIKGNTSEILKLPLDKKYLTGFLNATATEETDYDPNSSANQFRSAMGLNKVGKIKIKVSMFANRYPWEKALELFGAMKNKGAQKIK